MSNSTEQKVVKIIADGRQAEASINQITRAVAALNRERSKEKVGSDRYKELTKDLSGLNQRLTTARNEVRNLDSASKKFWGNFKTIAAGVVGGNLITGAIQGVQRVFSAAIDKAVEMADAFSNIRKVTGLNVLQVAQLDRQLGKIDTRTGRGELRELAVEAGKLGINGVANIAKFVKEADQIKVALGEDLGEGAVTTIGRLSNIFKVSMLEIGSAINDIGASSAATEAYQVDFLNRMAGTGPTVKLAADELLGYSATLENMGQSAEVSGTALSKFFIEFIKDTEKFGQIAGMQKGVLTDMLNSKGTNAAFLAFLQNLKESRGGAKQMADALDEMQIDGARSVGVFLSLANSIGDVEKNQAIANQAIKEGTSLTNEFNIKNENTAAKWEKIQKAVSGTFNKATNGIANEFIDLMYQMIDAPLSEELEKNQLEMNALYFEIIDVNTEEGRRIELIEQLKGLNPKYLSGINAQTISNQELAKSIELVNRAAINEIILQKELEKVQSKKLKAGELGSVRLDREQEVRIEMAKIAKENNLKIPLGKSLEEQILFIQDNVRKAKLGDFNESVMWFHNALREETKLMKELTAVTSEYEEKKKLLYDPSLDPTKINKRDGGTQAQRDAARNELDQERAKEMKSKGFVWSDSTGGWVYKGVSEGKTEETKSKSTKAKKEQEKYKSPLKDGETDGISMAGKTEASFEGKADRTKVDADLKKFRDEKERERIKEMEKKELALNIAGEVSDTTYELIKIRQQKELNSELALLDTKKEAQLSNEKLTAKEREKIEAEYQEKRRAILTDNARKEKRAAVIKATLDMALAIGEANPVIPLMTMAGIVGAGQIATILAQPIPQFQKGGVTAEDGKRYMAENVGSFSGGGIYNAPSVGLIGEKGSELVIPNWLYKSPKMVNTMAALESMIYNPKTFASGGATAPTAQNGTSFDDKELKMVLAMNANVMKQLNESLQKGIVAKTYYDRVEFEKYEARNAKTKSISKL